MMAARVLHVAILVLVPVSAFNVKHSRARAPTASAATGEQPIRTFNRAQLFSGESATALDVINVLGRWESCSEWAERTEFVDEADAGSSNSPDQAKTKKRYETAVRLGCVERVAFELNVPKLPFANEELAASVGKTCADFATPPAPVALNLVYDAIAQSKSGLVARDLVDERRNSWCTEEGSFDADAFQAALNKGTSIVLFAQATMYFFYASGAGVVAKVVIDAAGGRTAWS